jgi:hypothetical protein
MKRIDVIAEILLAAMSRSPMVEERDERQEERRDEDQERDDDS